MTKEEFIKKFSEDPEEIFGENWEKHIEGLSDEEINEGINQRYLETTEDELFE